MEKAIIECVKRGIKGKLKSCATAPSVISNLFNNSVTSCGNDGEKWKNKHTQSSLLFSGESLFPADVNIFGILPFSSCALNYSVAFPHIFMLPIGYFPDLV